jgi:outer membrane lipoprotein SlyB
MSRTAELARRAVGGSLLAALLVGATLLPATPAAAQSTTLQSILYGEVVSAEKAIVTGEAGGTGAQVGSTVGAVAGYAIADRGDRWLGALLGGVVGGVAGHAAEKKAKKKKGGRTEVTRVAR